MSDVHPINLTLLTLLDNQAARTEAALHELPDSILRASPGFDCNCILDIVRHLLDLRRFQLMLLESPLVADVPAADAFDDLPPLRDAVAAATDLVREAITVHDATDWFAVPDPPREGRWGDEPTLLRLGRPFNDFVNHLGAIRALRRTMGYPATVTQ